MAPTVPATGTSAASAERPGGAKEGKAWYSAGYVGPRHDGSIAKAAVSDPPIGVARFLIPRKLAESAAARITGRKCNGASPRRALGLRSPDRQHLATLGRRGQFRHPGRNLRAVYPGSP